MSKQKRKKMAFKIYYKSEPISQSKVMKRFRVHWFSGDVVLLGGGNITPQADNIVVGLGPFDSYFTCLCTKKKKKKKVINKWWNSIHPNGGPGFESRRGRVGIPLCTYFEYWRLYRILTYQRQNFNRISNKSSFKNLKIELKLISTNWNSARFFQQ